VPLALRLAIHPSHDAPALCGAVDRPRHEAARQDQHQQGGDRPGQGRDGGHPDAAPEQLQRAVQQRHGPGPRGVGPILPVVAGAVLEEPEGRARGTGPLPARRRILQPLLRPQPHRSPGLPDELVPHHDRQVGPPRAAPRGSPPCPAPATTVLTRRRVSATATAGAIPSRTCLHGYMPAWTGAAAWRATQPSCAPTSARTPRLGPPRADTPPPPAAGPPRQGSRRSPGERRATAADGPPRPRPAAAFRKGLPHPSGGPAGPGWARGAPDPEPGAGRAPAPRLPSPTTPRRR